MQLSRPSSSSPIHHHLLLVCCCRTPLLPRLLSTLCCVPSSMPSTSVVCSTRHPSSTFDVIMLCIKHLVSLCHVLATGATPQPHRIPSQCPKRDWELSLASYCIWNKPFFFYLAHLQNVLTAIKLQCQSRKVFPRPYVGDCLSGSVLFLFICFFLLHYFSYILIFGIIKPL